MTNYLLCQIWATLYFILAIQMAGSGTYFILLAIGIFIVFLPFLINMDK